MSATVSNRQARFPTDEVYGAVESAVVDAYNEIERLVGDVEAIVRAWEEDEEVLDRPTFETVGRLTEFLDGLDMDCEQLVGKRDELRTALHGVVMMRGEMERHQRREVDDARS